MNYWRRYGADYLADTQELSMIEDGAYGRLLDYCYAKERPLPSEIERVMTIARATKPEEQRAVRAVLSAHFELFADGYHNSRVDKELAIALQARTNGGKSGGRPKTGGRTGSTTGSQTEEGTKQETGRITGHETESVTGQQTGEGGGSGHPPSSILQPPTALPANPDPPPSTQGQPPSPGVAQKPRSPRRRNGLDEAPKTAETWNRYSAAYVQRYGTEPVRNATVNGQLAQVVKQLGQAEAPPVAEFYVSHNRSQYVNAKHATNLLLRDCTGLRTEWATGHRVTDTEARQADQTQARGDVFGRMLAESDAEHHE